MSQTGGERGDASTFRYPRHSPATNERKYEICEKPQVNDIYRSRLLPWPQM